jgi:WD40 repeat protein
MIDCKEQCLRSNGVRLFVILVLALLISCSGRGISPLNNGTLSHPDEATLSIPAPTTQPTLTLVHRPTVFPTPEPRPTLTLTLTPTFPPLPADCSDGLIVLKVSGYQGAIYLTCVNSGFTQRIMSDAFYVNGISGSPDSPVLAISRHDADGVGSVELLRISDHSRTTLFSEQSVLRNVQWSSDGEFVGYLKSESTGTDVVFEVYHLASGTRSEVIIEQGISYFDWSPDGARIVFGVDLLEPPFSHQRYVAEVDCDSAKNTCRATNQTAVPGIGIAVWTSDSSFLTTVKTSELEADEIILVSTPTGSIVKEFNLSAILPGIEDVTDLVWSPDGSRIAFCAAVGSGDNIYILDIDELSLMKLLHDEGYYCLDWLDW